MKFPKIEECNKGDITSIEICVERSSTNDDVWITMWKNEYEHFQVTRIDDKKQGEDKYQLIQRFTPDQTKVRLKYEEACKGLGLLPYPKDC